MLQRFSGYSKELLPFSRVICFKDAAKKVEPEKLSEYQRNRFLDDYKTYTKAIKLLDQRYSFYISILKGDKESERYIKDIGEKQLHERVAFALNNTFIEATNLAEKINSMSFDHYKKLSNIRDGHYLFEGSECERSGICLCKGKEKPYMYGCIDDLSLILEDKDTAREHFLESAKAAANIMKDVMESD